jgi:hypothetical protein
MPEKAADIVCIPRQEQKTSRKKTELLSLWAQEVEAASFF